MEGGRKRKRGREAWDGAYMTTSGSFGPTMVTGHLLLSRETVNTAAAPGASTSAS